jgi:hypothetical protein
VGQPVMRVVHGATNWFVEAIKLTRGLVGMGVERVRNAWQARKNSSQVVAL